jgi:hypothetical protein
LEELDAEVNINFSQRESRSGMSSFKKVMIYFLVSKLPVIYHPFLSPYLALSKNIGENNMMRDKFVVKATCIESTDLPCSLVKRLGLHIIHHLLEVRRVLGEVRFQGILEMFICHVGTLFILCHF